MQKLQITPIVRRVDYRRKTILAITSNEILDDGARLEHHEFTVANYGRFTERMNVLQFGRCQSGVRVTLIHDNLIGQFEFFEHPCDAT